MKALLAAIALIIAMPASATQIVGSIGVGNSDIDSTFGVRVLQNNIYKGFGIYGGAEATNASNLERDAKQLSGHKGLQSNYNGSAFTLGGTYTYNDWTFYTGYTKYDATLKIWNTHYASEHDYSAAGADLGFLYNTQPFVVGFGYNTATKTTNMNIGYSFN